MNHRLQGEISALCVTLGMYYVDFGSVVVCQSKTKLVQLRNMSTQSFGFKINKKVCKVTMPRETPPVECQAKSCYISGVPGSPSNAHEA